MIKHTETNTKKDKNKKRFITAVALLLCLLFIIIGMVAAFYSDYIWNAGDITSGTLKISGDYVYFLNGEEVELSDLHNLNPGDVIVVKGSIENDGNKSAWIRDLISFTTEDTVILPYLKIYEGEFTNEQFKAQVNLSEYLLTLSGEGVATTSAKVIDGTGSYAETEGPGTGFIGDYKYEVKFTIYFMSTATNETQGKTFNLKVGAQALQYRNNETEPNEEAWDTVVPVI